MKAEKVILSFVAIFIGLIAAGATFYVYQLTKTVPEKETQGITNQKPLASPTPDPNNFLTIESPRDEEVFDKKLITIRGKTAKGATILVTTEDSDEVVKPAQNGDFTLTQTIPNGTTNINIISIMPNGEEKRVTRTVTFSTESF